MSLQLKFIPLSEQSTNISLSQKYSVQTLIDLGETENLEDYYIAAEDELDYDEDTEKLLQFASTGTARPNAKSEQDSKDILIRYRYVGNKNPEREFCKKMMAANKIYRKEDIISMGDKLVNPGFGMHPNPNEPYSIWLYKGGGKLSDAYPGGTCRHKWNRVIYLKKGVNVDVNSPLAEIISTSEARRKGFDVPVNDSKVSIAPHEM